jgi:hypothetical protein
MGVGRALRKLVRNVVDANKEKREERKETQGEHTGRRKKKEMVN